jgi:flagellar basal-body rod protein FlgG
MIAQQRKHDTVTNNIANINTPGFKQGTALTRSFPEMLIERIRSGGGPGEPVNSRVGPLTTGVMADENIAVYAQGDIQETHNAYDFALISDIQIPGVQFDPSGKYVGPDGQRVVQPKAFFTVLMENGEQRYSLNGKFSVNVNGELVTSQGNRVLGRDGQPIVLIDPATRTPITNFRVTKTGLFTNADGQPLVGANGQPLNLLITRIEDPNQLILEGNGLYRLNAGSENIARPVGPNDEVEVRQGFIERSNVDPGQSMVDMMAALRAYEANQKVIQYYDKSMEKAVNEIGRI